MKNLFLFISISFLLLQCGDAAQIEKSRNNAATKNFSKNEKEERLTAAFLKTYKADMLPKDELDKLDTQEQIYNGLIAAAISLIEHQDLVYEATSIRLGNSISVTLPDTSLLNERFGDTPLYQYFSNPVFYKEYILIDYILGGKEEGMKISKLNYSSLDDRFYILKCSPHECIFSGFWSAKNCITQLLPYVKACGSISVQVSTSGNGYSISWQGCPAMPIQEWKPEKEDTTLKEKEYPLSAHNLTL